MQHKIAAIGLGVLLPLASFASFSDIYATRMSQLLGNPQQTIGALQTMESYGQEATIKAELDAAEVPGTIDIHTNIRQEKKGNAEGHVAVTVSGNMEEFSGKMSAALDLSLFSGSTYIKPTQIDLPEHIIDANTQSQLDLLKDKWIQIDSPVSFFGGNPLDISTHVTDNLTQTPIFESLQQTQRNGYDIHVVKVNDTGLSDLVAGMGALMDEITMTDTMTQLSELPTLSSVGVKTVGVIGQKGDEIKMGIVFKKTNDPHRMVITSVTTPQKSTLNLRLIHKLTKQSPVQFSRQINQISPLEKSATLSLTTTEEPIHIKANIQSRYYDAGTIHIQAPVESVSLETLIGMY